MQITLPHSALSKIQRIDEEEGRKGDKMSVEWKARGQSSCKEKEEEEGGGEGGREGRK